MARMIGATYGARRASASAAAPSPQDFEGVVLDGDVATRPLDWGNPSVLFRADLATEHVGAESWRSTAAAIRTRRRSIGSSPRRWPTSASAPIPADIQQKYIGMFEEVKALSGV